ncbi:hypothetical protein [Cellulomonas wangsupingiae]|uniref:DUF3800 domain-containing protein n=1 Tax=Cellulomonas wangsupingiae TaxID=2968085 RepID=A0ABY5K342_9CELL|nr:hypothetical protein [Cellulomonas wangsupingiae]MCC2336489.1 hypothetical protein [Cellulomonas wangsupingiae]UUI64634.1 hypothetical protein NP075_16165 [Cellulomonas wangsupingiae]
MFIDESMRSGYLLVAAVVLPEDVAATRRGIKELVGRGQRRLHMVKESEPRKRLILQRLNDLNVSATLYEAGPDHKTNIARRHACLERLVIDVVETGGARLCLETAAGVDGRDQQQLIELTRRLRCHDKLTYEHAPASREYLLAAPDAIAWAWSKGGEWRRRAAPLVTSVVAV